MSQTAIPVAEAARDFLRLVDLVERQRQSAVLLRDGRPVATVNPIAASLSCAELAERWTQLEKLSPEEGNAFADDLEQTRASLPPLKPVWD